MTADEMIEVIQAHKDNKTIEYRSGTPDNWSVLLKDGRTHQFNFKSYDYRIKPEPREWWLRSHHKDKTPCTSCGMFDSEADAVHRLPADNLIVKAIVHVREVLE